MRPVKTGSKFQLTLTYDSAERRRVEEEIAGLELIVAELQRRAAISMQPGDYYELSDTIQRLASLYARRCFFLLTDLSRCEASIASSARQAELPRPAVTDPSGEVVQQQTIGIAASRRCREEEDDWEALADKEASLANLSLSLPPADTAESEPPNADEPDAPARRRGRGSFLYRTNELYSDRDSEVQDAGINSSPEDSETARNQQYGTSHVILLYDFPSTTRIKYLESLFENFWERGVAIRRVSYTVALAVFRTPAAAQEALTGIEFPFKVRRLEDGDIPLHQIPQEDLEPPAARPRTSSRTARRMIGHAMGIEPGSSSSSSGAAGPEEFRMQEAARKDRLHQRHDMKDSAWGPD
ncbi:hypothetical protein KSP39_PZI004625 [Platanthera zijinensis]|uniref:Uncharacterized protein n=1 Tax=Platanthera zijinensis TaxID=2320716 RepID=A0AAP0BVF1_9ASPA